MIALRDRVEKEYGVRLSPREIDNLLLEVVRSRLQLPTGAKTA